jgi:RND superfamily putative drug exporter
MKKIIKARWFVFALWIVLAVVLNGFLPNMEQLAIDKGQPKIPSNESSRIGSQLLNQKNNVSIDSKEANILIVFSADKALTATQFDEIHQGVDKLKGNEKILHITSIADHFDNSNLKSEMVSGDNSTVLVSLNVDKSETSIDTICSGINSQLSSVSVSHYLTGGDLINNDMIATSQNGTKKTEIFTYAAIFLILLLVFRSPVAPVVSLLSIGLTYVCSRGLVSQLADKLNFPYSSSTSTFLILVLFGIGTDYTLLLMMRFREELKEKSIEDAVLSTYRTAGKTVLLSSLTVLVGFAVLAFAKFSIYQAVSAVAIAVIILLLELTTLLPCFMRLLGPNLFWPVKSRGGHKRSHLWETISSAAVKRPFVFLLAVLIATSPIILLYQSALSYDNLHEVSSSYDSVKAVDISSAKFGPGKLFPVNIMIQSNSPMDNQQALADIDKLNGDLVNLPGVKSVYSPTRPKGKKIDALYLNSQVKSVSDGLSSAQNGVIQIQDGLKGAVSQLQSSTGNSPEQLRTGTASLVSGLASVQNSAAELSSGISNLQQGADSLAVNLDKLTTSCRGLSNGLSGSTSASHQITQGIGKVSGNISKLQDMINQVSSSSSVMSSSMKTVGADLTSVGTNLTGIGTAVGDIGDKANSLRNLLSPDDKNYTSEMAAVGSIGSDAANIVKTLGSVNSSLSSVHATLSGLSSSNSGQGLSEAQIGLNTMAKGLNALKTASAQLNSGLISAADGQNKITAAAAKLSTGAKQLNSGLFTIAAGQKQLADGASKLSSASISIQAGQNKLIDGIENLSGQSSKLLSGLDGAIGGLDKVSDGLDSAKSYLSGLSASGESDSIFYIPDAQLKGADFKESLNSYMSDNRKITQITVYLSVDPYSAQALNVVNDIQNTVNANLQSGILKGSTVGIAGVSSQNRDLASVSSGDLARSTVIMLIGIAIILVFVTRSMLMPVFILISLLISYYSSYTVTELLFRHVFGAGDLTWTAPFFSFIMLIPLGVDYSIFLITRFREGKGLEPGKAMIDAAANTGSVIMSAAIILSATFAALYPSQITSQAELATTVIIGLFLLAFVFMPIFMPACVSLSSKLQKLKK